MARLRCRPAQVFALASRGVNYVEAAATLFDGAGSLGNGAAMRCAPAAVVGFPDPGLSMAIAADQAAVTHAHPEGRDGAVMLAAVVHLGLATPTTELLDLTAIKPGDLQLQSPTMHAVWGKLLDAATSPSKLTELAQQFGTSPAASQSVPAAIAVALAVDGDAIATIRAAIALGGDTDTIAAMAASVAGAHHGIAGLPADLLARLEAGDRIAQLADRLVELPGRR
jgi:poly(ADP-ribose) glycohydrolase ARH3